MPSEYEIISPDILSMWSVFLLFLYLGFSLSCFSPLMFSYHLRKLSAYPIEKGKERPEDLLVVLPFSAATEEISSACDSDPNRLELVRLYNEVKVP